MTGFARRMKRTGRYGDFVGERRRRRSGGRGVIDGGASGGNGLGRSYRAPQAAATLGKEGAAAGLHPLREPKTTMRATVRFEKSRWRTTGPSMWRRGNAMSTRMMLACHGERGRSISSYVFQIWR